MKTEKPNQGDTPSFADLCTPKLVTVLREGYGLLQLRADAIVGLTVAIVALPLSMAIAIASGATPVQGLYTAIVGGFLVPLFGGSRFQVDGPAGACIVLLAATVVQHAMDGLILSSVPFLDSTRANMIENLAHKAHKSGVTLWLIGASKDIRRVFINQGLKKLLVYYASIVDKAVLSLLIGTTANIHAA